jgi:ABC-2 type transport system permease protein
MDNIFTQASMELKNLRVFRTFIFMNLVLLPGSYVVIILLSRNVTESELSYQLSGFAIASLIGSFVSLLASRVSNMMQAEVLELYAALPVSTLEIVAAQAATYLLLTLPQTIAALALSAIFADSVRPGLVVIGLTASAAMFTLLGVTLGMLIRNPFVAQGILPLLAWILLLGSPIYYDSQRVQGVFLAVSLFNPITHALNVIRAPLGFPHIAPLEYSYLYIGLAVAVLAIFSVRRAKKLYMLEKLF